MSLYCGKLCSAILLEHFGEFNQKIGEVLLQYGPQSLSFITITSEIPLEKVRQCLCVLIKYGLVIHQQTVKGIRYQLKVDRIITMLRYPKFLHYIKNDYGDESEAMLEEVLKRGYETASHVIAKVYNTVEKKATTTMPSVEFFVEKFDVLVKNRFFIRSISTKNSDESTDKPLNDANQFDMPVLKISALKQMIHGDDVDAGDSKIYWNVNFDKFIEDFRDKFVVEAACRMLDDNAGHLMRKIILLMHTRTAAWVHSSNPIPYAEIKSEIKQLKIPALLQYLDQYLRLMEEDPRQFLKRVGDTGGGQFSVEVREIFANLAWATVDFIVMERFGSKAARIFRLVRSRKFIEQEQIHQLAMIPAKEAKHLTFTLVQESYIQMQDIKKASQSFAPSRAIYLFHIDLNQVVRMEVERCYQSLYNTMQRRQYEQVSNKRMMDKSMRMLAILSNLREHGAPAEQLDEIERMMSPSERSHLDKVLSSIKIMGCVELEIEDSLFLLTLYLRYH